MRQECIERRQGAIRKIVLVHICNPRGIRTSRNFIYKWSK